MIRKISLLNASIYKKQPYSQTGRSGERTSKGTPPTIWPLSCEARADHESPNK
ncbi:hypothetical protein DPMN_041147 [Dreissena polymorpha]|uniref:Uncharacterized protein n=1 Tax=Dreissena polymorpha TaxID=45954 RepID=A0A9D4CZN7_DREPO|nr:hypothetical protein DPMN_041147 [Dreissena polymorpha]